MIGTDAEAKQRREGLAEYAEQIGFSFRQGTPVITKIVKCVFAGVARSRVSTYSLVLREAKKKGVAIAGIPAFIEKAGGIEQIRLSKSPSYKSAKQKADGARPAVAGQVLAVASSDALTRLADCNFVDTQCVLIATQQADGTFAINALVRGGGALTAALVGYSGGNAAAIKDEAAKKEAANDDDIRTQIVLGIVNSK